MQEKIIKAMLNPETYDENVKTIKHLQTHISHVFLTGKFAYKIKKPVNFGFLDFTTLKKRKFYCKKELELNKRLSPEIYLEVVPIFRSGDKIKIKGGGKIVEYAVKMKELPQERMMSKLLEKNKITKRLVENLAKIVAEFHSKAKVDEKKNFGSIKTIKFNWDENFTQIKPFVNETIKRIQLDFIKRKVNEFLEENQALFKKRISQRRIRECHGDLHSDNIFLTDKFYILDAIEFNERFRFSDVASEVAFLSMDLDFYNRKDLSNHFVKNYVKYSKDEDLVKLLDFYRCYRALVRGKVTSFKLQDKSISSRKKKEIREKAKKYFDLAFNYAKKI